MAEVTLEEVPRKTRELFDKAAAAMERGNLDYAMDMLTAILDNEPRLLQARKLLRGAQLKHFREKGGGAISHALSSVTGLPGTIKASLQIGKNPLAALQTAEQLMRTDPLNKSFISLVVRSAEAAKLPEIAVHALETAREMNPDDVAVLNALGRLYGETGDPAAARTCFEQVVSLKPTDPQAIKALKDAQAMETMSRGRWSEATSYRDVIKDTDEAKLLEQEGKAVKSDRDVEDLIAETEKKVETDPANVNYQRALADLYARAGRFEDALKLLHKASEASGGGDPQIDRAITNVRVRQFESEIAALREGGREAEAAARAQELDAFRLSDAEHRVARYPNDLQFKYEYGVLLFDREQFDEAIKQFQLAQRNPQRRNRAMYYLARCFEQKGQYDIAAEQLERAASELSLMDETKKDIIYELGLVCEKMGRKEKAVEHFKEIYAVDISFRDVSQRIEKAYKG